MGFLTTLIFAILLFIISPAHAAPVTDSEVAQGCRTDVLDIFDNGSNAEMHTHADSVTYEAVPFSHGSNEGVEVRGFVSGIGFAPITEDGNSQPLVHYHYNLPFKVWYLGEKASARALGSGRGETLVGFLHGFTKLQFVPGKVQIEWLGNEWLKNAMLRRDIAFLAFNQTGRNEEGEYTARLADGTPVQPIASSPHILNSTCAVRNLVEKIKARPFDQTILLSDNLRAGTLIQMAGGRSFDGRKGRSPA
jgi:hypothetical protein